MTTWQTHWELFGTAYIASILLAIMGAYLGVYVILRRIAFLGVALIQVASLGVAISYILHGNPLLFSFGVTIIGVLLFTYTTSNKTMPSEGIIAAIYCSAGAFALLFIKQSAVGTEELKEYLYGQILLINSPQLYAIATVFVIAMAFFIMFSKEILFVSFDSETAQAMGYNVRIWNFIFYFLLATVIAVSTKAAGVLVMFSYLVIPAVTALLLAKSLQASLTFAVIFSVSATILGLFLQHVWQIPPGQTIVAVATWQLITVSVYKKSPKISIALNILCIVLFFYQSSPATPAETNQQNHSHPSIEMQVTPKLVTAEQISLEISVTSSYSTAKDFYMHLDLQGANLTRKFSIPALSQTQHFWKIPRDEAIQQGILLPIFSQDPQISTPINFEIHCDVIVIED